MRGNITVAGVCLVAFAWSCSALVRVDDGLTNGEPLTDASTEASSVDAKVGATACPSEGYRCVEQPPVGWEGPLFLYDGPAAAVPACPETMAETKLDAHRDLKAAAHACTPCTCASPVGATCTTRFAFANLSDCSDVSLESPFTLNGACNQVTSTAYFFGVGNGGSCAPSTASPIRTDVSWNVATRACGAQKLLQTGCTLGTVCAPEPASPFYGKHCVMQRGDQTCPQGPYSTKLVSYAGVADGRGCAACTCGAPANVGCSGSVMRYLPQGMGCGGTASPLAVPGCSVGGADVKALAALRADGGACPPDGGAPTGVVTAADEVTLCCVP